MNKKTVIQAPFLERHLFLSWIYHHLLTPWYNFILSGCALFLIYATLLPLVSWTCFEANWNVIFSNLCLFLIGVYPAELSGLALTLLIASVGITCSFPLGLLLALGRQSSLKVIRGTSIAYIELIRGVPLITILFIMQVMLPLFLPEGIHIGRVLRAMLAFIFFSAAYLAEDIRGGLQAIPKGQEEAGYALGLGYWKNMRFVILPQALRHVVPVLVGRFISLFKDTSLVAVVGLLDLLGISQSILANPQFLGLQKEVYLFIGLIYWLISYSMSYISYKLEKTKNE